MKYRQTLIWEFLNKKVLRPIDKLKVMCRLNDYFLFSHQRSYNLFKRVSDLEVSFILKLKGSQARYYSSLTKRYLDKQISLKQFDNNLKNFFNYYKA